MNLKAICLLCYALFVVESIQAQTKNTLPVYLKKGIVQPAENIGETVRRFSSSRKAAGAKEFVIIQFSQIPSAHSLQLLRAGGIELLEYIPENAYTATIHKGLDEALLKSCHARAIIDLTPEQKIHPALLSGFLSTHNQKTTDQADVRLSYPASFSKEEIVRQIAGFGITLLSGRLLPYQIAEVRVPKVQLLSLAAQPWVQYIEPLPAADVPLNDKSMAGTRANILTAQSPTGYGLNGAGVVIGIGDDGDLNNHIDVRNRVVTQVPMSAAWHGLHVAGTAAGAGNLNEKYKGYAPGATIVSRSSSDVWRTAPDLVRDFGMVVTNNSYSPSNDASGCTGFGTYNSDSYILDRQAFELPNLIHVFAAGNSGAAEACPGIPAGFGNVLGAYATAKNVISVGQIGTTGLIAKASSKGPVRDGRIKPELAAPGSGIFSTTPVNNYQGASGTSMAAPAVSGGLALLYQRYKSAHAGNNPSNALMKALIVNGATDKGLTGADYSYGFGGMNLLRSVTMLDAGNYRTGTLANQAHGSHEIVVPANTALVKVMLYWNDPAPSILTGEKMLVNNLDITLTRSGNVARPLFPGGANPLAPAATGTDEINNMEQVVLESPEAGTYSIDVFAKKIPQGVQEYYVVYDIIPVSTIITYPAGGERLTKSDVVNIGWDSYGHAGSTYSVYFSPDNGRSWSAIQTNVEASVNQISWTVPDVITTEAKMRIVQNATGTTTDGAAFTILGIPAVTLAAVQCQTYAAIQWTAVPGATDYEVMLLEGDEMKPVATTSDLKYTYRGLSKDQTYYLTVRARKNGVPGRRATAVSRKPDNGTCTGDISDRDLGVEAILSPKSAGRKNTSSGLSATETIKISLRNLDDEALTQPFEVGYSIGDGAVHWETVTTGLAALSKMEYSFNQTANFQSVGSHILKVFLKLDGDRLADNNSIFKTIRQLPNEPLLLPYLENAESLPAQEITTTTIGISGADRYDVSTLQANGRMRTSVQPALASSGSKSFTMDSRLWGGNDEATYLEGTYNLASVNAETEEVRLSFRFKKYGEYYHSGDVGVYIRGKDTDTWIAAFDYETIKYVQVQNGFRLAMVEVSDLLKKNGQQFSSSFQVRWSQKSYYPATTDGYTIDDIQLYKTTSDIALTKIIAPSVAACSNNGGADISMIVKNNGREDAFNIPVKIEIDGRTFVKTIPVARAGSDTTCVFPFSSEIRTPGSHTLRVRVEKAHDTNPGNDSGEVQLTNPGVVASFPYLETFENGDGGWQKGGTNVSWQFGKPNSSKVKSAASGQNAWKTGLTGTYNSNELSYLYSPCFYLNGMSHPTLSFSFSVDTENCEGGNCDIAYVEYNLGGSEWVRLGDQGRGVNWYNAGNQWSVQNYDRWHVATVPLPFQSDTYVRFRFVLKSNGSNQREGIAVDDIHIYDLPRSIYDPSRTETASANAQVQGDGWVTLTTSESVVAAIHPRNQNLGNVLVKASLNHGNVRKHNSQYYLDRSFVITAEYNSPSAPIGLRLYFSDREAETLLAAPDDPKTGKPRSAYDLAVSQYSGNNEDNNLLNNSNAGWAFFPKTTLTKVPYGNGYYVELDIRNFSEFWFANDFLGNNSALPVELASFSAKALPASDGNAAALLEWKTSSEVDFSYFNIEVAIGNRAMLTNEFLSIGQVKARGAGSDYRFTDRVDQNSDTRYYRLRMVDTDGSEAYSSIRPVQLRSETQWTVFPNPTKGQVEVAFEAQKGESVELQWFDSAGRPVGNKQVTAGGGHQKQQIDLSGQARSGIYMLQVTSGQKKQSFKIIRE